MELNNFQAMKAEFERASIDEKIEMYIHAENLSQTQFMELLRVFPREHITKLEEAMNY